MIATSSCILATVVLLFTEPIISDHLIEIGVSEHYIGMPIITSIIGYIFALACLSYALAAPIVGHLTSESKFSKQALTLFAFILSSIALLIQGPSKLLGFE